MKLTKEQARALLEKLPKERRLSFALALYQGVRLEPRDIPLIGTGDHK